jgi:uncharacterized membrane protein YfcA
LIYALLFVVALWAGIQNALAGGGTFITFPVLLMAGLDARAANITSTIALFPGQVTTALAGRSQVSGNAQLSVRELVVLSLVGGVVGAGLLLLTPSHFFERLVPFLVLVATAIFAGVMNFAAVAVFAFSRDVDWVFAAVLAGGSIIGGQVGAYLLARINVMLLRIFVIVIGIVLTIGLFVRAY